jgi:serine/threonine protein kinase
MYPYDRNALPAGYRFGNYRIESVLGSGLFGITYLAKNDLLHEEYAIKEYFPIHLAVRDTKTMNIIPKTQAEGSDLRWGMDRFCDEARTIARICHRNIVQVRDLFISNNTAYMVMKYERGVVFRQYFDHDVRRRTDELLYFSKQILEGLHALHEKGCLHWDIKPENILIRHNDEIVLLDFGKTRYEIAKKLNKIPTVISRYSPIEMYMADGCQGPWTDIYGLGGVLYNVISGEEPEEAPSRINRVTHLTAQKIGRIKYDEYFLKAIDHALEVDTYFRPQSVEEFKQELVSSHHFRKPQACSHDLPRPMCAPHVVIGEPIKGKIHKTYEEVEIRTEEDKKCKASEDINRRKRNTKEVQHKIDAKEYGIFKSERILKKIISLFRRSSKNEKAENLMLRDIRALSPSKAPRTRPFKIHVEIGKPGIEMPQPDIGEVVAGTDSMKFVSKEKSPEIVIYVRSDLFDISPLRPIHVRLDQRDYIRISFTAKLSDDFQDEEAYGRFMIDIYYCDERISGVSFDIPLEDKIFQSQVQNTCPQCGARMPQQMNFCGICGASILEKDKNNKPLVVEQVFKFEEHLSPGKAQKFMELFDSAHSLKMEETKHLPMPIEIPYSKMNNVSTAFEKAGWIPLVFEAFLRYHICILNDPEKLRKQKGRQTLGLLRNMFESFLESKNTISKQGVPKYLEIYRTEPYPWILSSLIDYRNRIWGHPKFFPSLEHCEELEVVYRKKLDILLHVICSKQQTIQLAVVNNEGGLQALPDLRKFDHYCKTLAELKSGQVVLVIDDELLSLDSIMYWGKCSLCDFNHLYLISGIDNDNPLYQEVTGSCTSQDVISLLN